MCSEDLKGQLESYLKCSLSRRPGEKYGLVKALAKALKVQLLLPIVPRVTMGAFQFCQPFLISTLLNYLQQPTKAANDGYGIIGATMLVYTGIAVSGAFYWYFQERAMYMARGALAGVIYQKTVNSRLVAEDSTVLTLMSADIERIIRGCLNIHEFWANTIQVGLACWLLSVQIGAAFVAPVIVVGCCIVCSTILSKYTGPRQKAWMEEIQKRVGLTSKVIGQMKYLKISGLAHHVEESIQKMRVDELKTGAKFRMILILSAVLGYTPLFISPVIVFAFTDRTLGLTKIFTSISYILLLASPLGVVFQSLPGFIAALTCLNRIQTFLEEDSRLDFRESVQTRQLSENTEIQEIKPDDGGCKYPPVIKISDGGFGWQANKLNLKDIELNIPKSRLTIVIGPVASGKSTLCKALLGETPIAKGQVVMNFDTGPTGYCDQTPFLTNATIRENIVGFASFDERRYSEVIEAAMLQHDLVVLLPQGDQTRIGSNGITLSGGQKQRVAIARALYLNSSFYIFDDVLSGLDTDTEEKVFQKVFSAEGFLRQRNATVVLCTHSLRHLPSADQIVAFDINGRIVEQGTFHELLANKKYVYGLGVKESATLMGEDSLEIVNENSPAQPNSLQGPMSKLVTSNTTQEEQLRMLGDLSTYRHYLSSIDKSSILALFVSGLGWGFFYNFTTVWLKFWSDDVTSAHQKYPNSFYLGLYALFQVSTLASLFLMSRVCFKTIILASGAKLHKEALRTVINAPLKFFATTDTGLVTNLFSQDMTLIDGQLPMSMANLVLYSFSSLGMAIVSECPS
jgi:ABC-type multidrug transport system fused ATPase/permease subunit